MGYRSRVVASGHLPVWNQALARNVREITDGEAECISDVEEAFIEQAASAVLDVDEDVSRYPGG